MFLLYRSATARPARPTKPGTAVAKAPLPSMPLEAALPAADVALPTTPPEEEELPLVADEPLEEPLLLLPEEELLTLEEPEELSEELPPVMLLRTEPGWC